MRLNGERFAVFPDYMQLLRENPLERTSHLFDHTKVSNTKKLVLAQFYDVLARNGAEKDLEAAIRKSLTEYKQKVVEEQSLVGIDRDHLSDLKAELQ
jgi:hypothetical protein